MGDRFAEILVAGVGIIFMIFGILLLGFVCYLYLRTGTWDSGPSLIIVPELLGASILQFRDNWTGLYRMLDAVPLWLVLIFGGMFIVGSVN